MRYKFRGKRKDNGEWVYGSLLINTIENNGQIEKQYRIQDITYGIFPNDFMCGLDEIVDHSTVGQYVNKMDQRGQQLFTGDIVREACMEENMNETRSFHKKVIIINHTHFSEKPEHMRLWKKIGNIHDNPNLLESEGK